MGNYCTQIHNGITKQQ